MVHMSPTEQIYGDLNSAFVEFNKRLFDDKLPQCLVTLQRRNKSYGFFAGDRFGTRTGEERTDEIALNPAHFEECTMEEIFSTLVHEMVHLWQHHLGKKSRPGYHNREWAAKMKEVGLYPSKTGEEGGKETGQQMDHYIIPGGRFDKACAAILKKGVGVIYVEVAAVTPEAKKEKELKEKKAASKTKYTCPQCELHAWAKPDTFLICGKDQVTLEPENPDEAASEEEEKEAEETAA
jgi:predicted SprT family Zn-dependent metalloprotease